MGANGFHFFVYIYYNKAIMKILSKYKEYYDYLSGIYGEDPLIILDRREGRVVKEHMASEKITLYIGGYKIEGYNPKPESKHYNGGKIYWGDELKAIDDYESLEETYWRARTKHRTDPLRKYYHNKHSVDWDLRSSDLTRDDVTFIDLNKNGSDCLFRHKLMPDSKHINDKADCPIIYKSTAIVEIKYPSLTELNLNTAIKPDDLYRMIYEWLSNKRTMAENHVDNLNDIQKLQNKGFDKKTSFRPNIK